MTDLVKRLRVAAGRYADYPDLVSLLNEAAEEFDPVPVDCRWCLGPCLGNCPAVL